MEKTSKYFAADDSAEGNQQKRRLDASFYEQDCQTLAVDLLSKVLVRRLVDGSEVGQWT